jgi:HEAT repeat protein
MANHYPYNLSGYGQATRPRALTAAAAAAAVLGKQRHSVDILKIIRLLSNPDPAIRCGAIKNLAALGGKDVINALIRAMNDPDYQVRSAACSALGDLRAHTAKTVLYDALKDPNPFVRIAAASALAVMGDSFGLGDVVKLLRLPGNHRLNALQCFNRLARTHFPLNNLGLDQALDWIKKSRQFPRN